MAVARVNAAVLVVSANLEEEEEEERRKREDMKWAVAGV